MINTNTENYHGSNTVFLVGVLMSVVGGVFITFAVVALCYRSVVVHRNFSLCLRLVFPEKKITKKLKQLVFHKKKLIKVKIVQIFFI